MPISGKFVGEAGAYLGMTATVEFAETSEKGED
jgi:hypothetical protein